MKKTIILVLAFCASISAQNIGFYISNPGHVLTVSNAGTKDITRFETDITDAFGTVLFTYEREVTIPAHSYRTFDRIYIPAPHAGKQLFAVPHRQSITPDTGTCIFWGDSASATQNGVYVPPQTDSHGNQYDLASAVSNGGIVEVSSTTSIHENCTGGLYTGLLSTNIGIQANCPGGQISISSFSQPVYGTGGSLQLIQSLGTISPLYGGGTNPYMKWNVGTTSPIVGGDRSGPCH